MSSYTEPTREDLERRFGAHEMADLLEDPDAFEDAVADAWALVEGYVGALYALPLAPPPPLVLSLVADVARYRLWDDKAPKEVRQRYDDALTVLKDIAKGTLKLPSLPNTVTQAEFSGSIVSIERERTFTDATLGGFVGRGGYDWPPRTD